MMNGERSVKGCTEHMVRRGTSEHIKHDKTTCNNENECHQSDTFVVHFNRRCNTASRRRRRRRRRCQANGDGLKCEDKA